MKLVQAVAATVLVSSVLYAQAPANGSSEVQTLREELRAQQLQFQEEIRKRDAMLQEIQQQLAEIRQQMRTAQSAPAAAPAAAGNGDQDPVQRLQADVADLKTNMTNTAVSAQEDQKRIATVEGMVNRFRWIGDVRVRYENFYQESAGCVPPACDPRHRARLRVRFGLEGKVNEDFTGGIVVASGSNDRGLASYTDPVSSNQTMTDFFERKTIGIDRAWVSYQPMNRKWLSLTGGKFSYTWLRTPMMFDNDLNPEGVSEKISWDFGGGLLKNVSLTGMQLFFNEASRGTDSWASGGQLSTKLQLGPVTITPAATLLKWNAENAIAAAIVGRTLAGNPNTNATNPERSAYLSGFFNSDYVLDASVSTPWKRFPVRLLLNYTRNLDAISDQDTATWSEIAFGQARERNDVQFGYSFARIEQDALLAAFNESDMRAATNVAQHRVFASWLPQRNSTVNWTWWIGRTLNTALQNAALINGVAPGEQEPFLKRMQLDLIYKF